MCAGIRGLQTTDKDLDFPLGWKEWEMLVHTELAWKARSWLDPEHAWHLNSVWRNEPLPLSPADCCASHVEMIVVIGPLLDPESFVGSESGMIWIGGWGEGGAVMSHRS